MDPWSVSLCRNTCFTFVVILNEVKNLIIPE